MPAASAIAACAMRMFFWNPRAWPCSSGWIGEYLWRLLKSFPRPGLKPTVKETSRGAV
jgi:hypothetical protein